MNNRSSLYSIGVDTNDVYNTFDGEIGLSWGQVMLLVICGASVAVCGVVVYAQLRWWRRLRDLSNLVVFISVVADLMNALVHLAFMWIVGHQVEDTKYNQVVCHFAWVVIFSGYGWSSWSGLFIARQRYDAITRPFHPLLTVRRTCVAAVAICVGCIVVAVVPSTGVVNKPGLFHLGNNHTGFCLLYFDNDVGAEQIACLILQFVILSFAPLFLAGFFFVRLVAHARKMLDPLHAFPLGMQAAQRQQTVKLIRSRGFRCILAIVMSDMLLVIPFHVAEVTKMSTGYPRRTGMRVMGLLYSANVVTHSIVYVVWLKLLRLQLRRIFCCQDAARDLPDWVTHIQTRNKEKTKEGTHNTKI